MTCSKLHKNENKSDLENENITASLQPYARILLKFRGEQQLIVIEDATSLAQ